MNNQSDIAMGSTNNIPRRPVIHKLESSDERARGKTILSALLIVGFGVFSGWALFRSMGMKTIGGMGKEGTAGESKLVVGSADAKTFKDSAQGELESGGIDGEGTHKLIRPGGDSQTVVLTSSVLDLSQFEGKRVKVWGETFAAQKAGWLMDVGKVEVLGN